VFFTLPQHISFTVHSTTEKLQNYLIWLNLRRVFKTDIRVFMITTKLVLRSFLLLLLSFVTIILLSSVVVATMEATSYAQLLLKVKTGNNKNETNTLASPSVQATYGEDYFAY
jgi:hypothetical protein